MSIHTVSKRAILLVATLVLVACVDDYDEASVAALLAKPTAEPATAQPATRDRLMSTETAAQTPLPSASAEPEATLSPTELFPDLGLAPEIENELWLNTDRPLNLATLRGKVVLVEFWTFG